MQRAIEHGQRGARLNVTRDAFDTLKKYMPNCRKGKNILAKTSSCYITPLATAKYAMQNLHMCFVLRDVNPVHSIVQQGGRLIVADVYTTMFDHDNEDA